MKTITIPSDVVLKNADETPALDPNGQAVVFTFKDFLTKTVLLDPKFGSGMMSILAAVDMKNQLDKGGVDLHVEDTHWDKLMEVIMSPSSSFNPLIAMQIVGFFLAIKNAT